MVTLTRWYQDEALDAIWDETAADYLAACQARTERLMALALRRDEETQDLVVLDEAGVDAYLAYAGRDYDIEEVA